jgi:hypothetical protein
MENYKLPLIAVLSAICVAGFSQVGIGTTSPSEVLDIESSDATKTAVDINNTSTGDPLIHFQVSGTSIFSIGIDNSDGDKFKIGTTSVSTSTSLTIDANGDVGINDTDPGYKLEVDGNINMVNGTDVYRIGAVHALSKPNTKNIYVGEGAGNANDASGTDNTFVGYQAGFTNTSADYNVYLGSGAGYSGTTGGTNTAIGFQAGYSNSVGTGNIFLGYQAGYSETGSNKLYIDNSNTSTPLIYGDFSTDEITINGSLIVNEQSASEDFRVESDNNTHMLFVDGSADQVIIGSENSFTIGSSALDFQVTGTDGSAGVGLVKHVADATGSSLAMVKARGTEGSATIVNDGDVLGSIDFYAYDGTDYVSKGASIEAAIQGTPGSDDVPTKLSFMTSADGSASPTTRMTILPSGFVGIGQTVPTTQLFVESSGSTVATFNRTNDGTIIEFQQGGTAEGSVTITAGTLLYNAFTGAHFGYSKKSFERGYLVSLNGKNENYHGSVKSEILYGISYTTKQNDPSVLGSYSSVLEPTKKHDLDNPHQIMAVGNGVMWITDSGENLKVGDYLISSSVKGCAMKDPQSDEVSYVVARLAENVNWNDVEVDRKGVKKVLVSVFYESFKKYNHRAKLKLLQEELEALKLLIKE